MDDYNLKQDVSPPLNNARLDSMAEAIKVLEPQARVLGRSIDFDLFNLEFSLGNLTDISPERYMELARKVSR